MSETDPDLDRIAESLIGSAPVDWDAETAARPDLRPLLDELRVVDSVAGFHREALGPAVPSPPRPTPSPDLERSAWGALEIREQIGRGAFAEVFRAYDPALEREVALKLLTSERALPLFSSQKFLEEARRLARVSHRNVVVVHGADQQDGRVGVWMELVDGRTLEDILVEDGPFGAHETAAIGMDLCRALAAIHAAGLIHGDVKPANVMRETGGRIVLMDFGAVRELDEGSGSAALSYGTPGAMAPEVLRGARGDARADLYSLGVVLFRLLTGRHPVEADDLPELMRKHDQGERLRLRDLRPDLPHELVRVIERTLEPSPDARPATAGAMESALAAAVGVAANPPPRRGSGAARWLAAVAVIVLVAFPAWWFFVRPHREIESPQVIANTVTGSDLTGGSVVPLSASVHLYRETGAVRAELRRGDPVAPGDELTLDLQGSIDLYAYVLNEDASGQVFVLFPVPGLVPSNPLKVGGTHHLPGRIDDKQMRWQVTSAGGREVVIVVASRQPLADLERDIAAFPRAQKNQPITYGELGPQSLIALRGIGGLSSGATSGAGARTRLADLLATLDPAAGDVWAWQTELTNRR